MYTYNFVNYHKVLDSYDYSEDPYNPADEEFEIYLKLLDEFDPVKNPPKPKERFDYVKQMIIPILLEHCKSLEAIMTVDSNDKSMIITIFSKQFQIIQEDTEIYKIINYANSILLEPYDDKVKLELIFTVF